MRFPFRRLPMTFAPFSKPISDSGSCRLFILYAARTLSFVTF